MSGPQSGPTLSLIVPCWNDTAALSVLFEKVGALRGIAEIVVAEASEADGARIAAAAAGAKVVHCARPNRGGQMNAGARLATGEALLFHHADTDISQLHVSALLAALRDPAVVGGAFHRQYDGRHAGFDWLEKVARAWSRFGGTFYGDQSLFVRRRVFEQLGGFAEIPLMEDVEFSRRLRRAGRTVVLDPPIATSPRRHAHRGPWRTTAGNVTLLALYRLGVSPERLHRWYYRGAGTPESS